jgi:hypothetical protein
MMHSRLNKIVAAETPKGIGAVRRGVNFGYH